MIIIALSRVIFAIVKTVNNMFKIVIFLLINIITSPAYALEPVTAFDDRFAVPSNCSITEASLFYPGSESFASGRFAVLGYRIPFGMEDLAVSTLHAGMNFGRAGVSVSFNGSGFDLYGEDQEKIGASFLLLDTAAAGVRLTRSAMRIEGFGQTNAWSADIGMVMHLLDSVFLAASVEDIAGAELGESKEPLDGAVRFAASWEIAEQVTLLSSVEKVRRFQPSLGCGCTVNLLDALTVGVIGGNEPDRFEFLGEVAVSILSFSYRGSYHREMGMTHGFSLRWSGD